MKEVGVHIQPVFEDADTQAPWNAAASAQGKPGPIDPLDAERIQRSHRAVSSVEAHFPLHSPLGVYPRGINARVSDAGHWASMTPNEGGGWHVRVVNPDDPSQEHRADLSTRDDALGSALLAHLARPDVRREVGLL